MEQKRHLASPLSPGPQSGPTDPRAELIFTGWFKNGDVLLDAGDAQAERTNRRGEEGRKEGRFLFT